MKNAEEAVARPADTIEQLADEQLTTPETTNVPDANVETPEENVSDYYDYTYSTAQDDHSTYETQTSRSTLNKILDWMYDHPVLTAGMGISAVILLDAVVAKVRGKT